MTGDDGGESVSATDEDFGATKRRKLERIESILAPGREFVRRELQLDFLDDAMRAEWGIVDTENVSAHGYDEIARAMVADLADGLVLDCGAGKRSIYYDNVVNLEIVPYDTTDVLCVGELLPFADAVFDGVLSLNVPEHVKSPFQAADELLRVLKPGGKLYCVVPFLQPLHAYPHHYYNMTHEGLLNLFGDAVEVESHEVPLSGRPIWTLTWMLQVWANGLSDDLRESFLNMTVADLVGDPGSMLGERFVAEVPRAVNFELASTTALVATKR